MSFRPLFHALPFRVSLRGTPRIPRGLLLAALVAVLPMALALPASALCGNATVHGNATGQGNATGMVRTRSVRSACTEFLKASVDPRLDADESYSWLVFDVAANRTLLSINGSASRQTASMVKPYIAASFFHYLEGSNQTYTPKERRFMERMLHVSANKPANWFMKRLGGPEKVGDILRANSPSLASGLNVVEYIPRNGRTYHNNATLENHKNLLMALWNREIPYSEEILRPMRHRIWLTRGKSLVDVYFKSGSTARLIGNMILAPSLGEKWDRPVIIVGAFEKKNRSTSYGWWKRERHRLIGAFFRTVARALTGPGSAEAL